MREEDEQLVFRGSAGIENGTVTIPAVHEVTFDDVYRVVVLKLGSLPVQIVHVRFAKGSNLLETPAFLPIDLNEDGKFSLSDLIGGYAR